MYGSPHSSPGNLWHYRGSRRPPCLHLAQLESTHAHPGCFWREIGRQASGNRLSVRSRETYRVAYLLTRQVSRSWFGINAHPAYQGTVRFRKVEGSSIRYLCRPNAAMVDDRVAVLSKNVLTCKRCRCIPAWPDRERCGGTAALDPPTPPRQGYRRSMRGNTEKKQKKNERTERACLSTLVYSMR